VKFFTGNETSLTVCGLLCCHAATNRQTDGQHRLCTGGVSEFEEMGFQVTFENENVFA